MSDGFDLRDYQIEAVESVFRNWDNGVRSTMVVLPTGCHARQKILMFDGSVKSVEDIVVGDQLAGPNLAPRRVLRLERGFEAMYDIIPDVGRPWRVNGSHIISMKNPYSDKWVDMETRDVCKVHNRVRDQNRAMLVRIGKNGQERVHFRVEPVGHSEDYFGFTVDGDHRYLLDDFTVTHNCGKTVVASSIAERLWERHHTKEDLYSGAILFLAHREELITQTHAKFRKHIPDAKIAIEMADYRAYGQLHRKPEIVIASTSSMLSRYKKYPKDYFGAAFVDECHHSVGKSYTEPLAHFNDNLKFLLGLTVLQTPEGSERMLNAPIPPRRFLPVRKEIAEQKDCNAPSGRHAFVCRIPGFESYSRQADRGRDHRQPNLLIARGAHLARTQRQTTQTKRPLDFSSGLSGSMRSWATCMMSRCIQVLFRLPIRPGYHPGRVGTVSPTT